MWGLSLLNNRMLQGVVVIAAAALGLVLYGDHKHREGRAELAAEIAIAAAEKRGETSATIEDIKEDLDHATDDELVDRIIGGGWLLEDD